MKSRESLIERLFCSIQANAAKAADALSWPWSWTGSSDFDRSICDGNMFVSEINEYLLYLRFWHFGMSVDLANKGLKIRVWVKASSAFNELNFTAPLWVATKVFTTWSTNSTIWISYDFRFGFSDFCRHNLSVKIWWSRRQSKPLLVHHLPCLPQDSPLINLRPSFGRGQPVSTASWLFFDVSDFKKQSLHLSKFFLSSTSPLRRDQCFAAAPN